MKRKYLHLKVLSRYDKNKRSLKSEDYPLKKSIVNPTINEEMFKIVINSKFVLPSMIYYNVNDTL